MAMTTAVIEAYRPGDEIGIVNVWNRAMPTDPVDLRRVTAQILCEPNAEEEGLLIARSEAGQVVGFAYATVRRLAPGPGALLDTENAWINAFAVDPDVRRQGIGTALMDKVQTYARARERKALLVAGFAPRYFAPGLDTARYPEAAGFLRSLGFLPGHESVSMQADLLNFAIPADVVSVEAQANREGFVFETLSPAYLLRLAHFIREHFQPGAAQAIQDAVTYGGDMRQVWIARRGEEVVGYCMHGLYDGNPERFGPFGVREDLRGKGIGKVLLYRCMEGMHRRGLRLVWFWSTGEKSPAGYLYRRAGFETVRRFETFRKELGT